MGNGSHDHHAKTHIYIMWVEGVWRREIIKVKVVVAMRMPTGRSQGRGEQPPGQ